MEEPITLREAILCELDAATGPLPALKLRRQLQARVGPAPWLECANPMYQELDRLTAEGVLRFHVGRGWELVERQQA